MQIINKMAQCSECGCIAFPDAMYCPKCGASYREGKGKKEINRTSSISTPSPIDSAQSLKETCNKPPCSHWGQVVEIKTIVVIPNAKCPICQGS